MSRVAFVQPIFAPDQLRLDRNLASLESIAAYFDAYPYEDMDFHFGGWALDEYWPQIQEVIETRFKDKKHVAKKFNKNFGKALVVNTLMTGVECDYILTVDSDILFLPEHDNMVQRLIECVPATNHFHKKPFGVIGLNQEGDCHHREKTYEITREIPTKYGIEKVSWGMPDLEDHEPYECTTHIAGGCIFLSKYAWDKLRGYRVMGVYAGDDTYLMKDLGEGGFNYQLIQTLGICHPPEDDEEYQKWKDKVTKKYSGERKKNIDKIIEETDEFWSSRNE